VLAWWPRRHRSLLLAVCLLAAIMLLRISNPHPGDAVLILFVVPIVICAIEWGPAGGVVASAVALVLTGLWQLSGEPEITAVGYAARATAFLVVGVIVGYYAQERRTWEHRLGRTLDVAVDLQCIAGADGYFKRINPAWCALLGYSEHELLTRPFVDFVHPDDVQRTILETERLAGDATTSDFENRYRTSSGAWRWLAWTARSVPEEGLIYASARDITDQRTYRESLEDLVAQRTRDLEAARVEALQRLALAAEYRDEDTHQHMERVGALCALLAERLGFTGDFVNNLRAAAPLHDVGKLGVSDAILLKPGPLTAQERTRMQTHTTIGAAILSGSTNPVLQLAEVIALSHHERWDGAGYPNGLREGTIPLAGRIVAVVDVFDALTRERPYKPAWPVERAANAITAGRGSQFDPAVVDAFVEVWRAGELAPAIAGAEDYAARPAQLPGARR
jgi:PAS domain S-box-containing protein